MNIVEGKGMQENIHVMTRHCRVCVINSRKLEIVKMLTSGNESNRAAILICTCDFDQYHTLFSKRLISLYEVLQKVNNSCN